jgi:hypothetical protein
VQRGRHIYGGVAGQARGGHAESALVAHGKHVYGTAASCRCVHVGVGVQKIPMSLLCNGDVERPLRIEVLDFDKGGRHRAMGQVDSSVRELLASNGAALLVIEPAKKAERGAKYLNSGTLHASHCLIEENPTFADVRSNAYIVFVRTILTRMSTFFPVLCSSWRAGCRYQWWWRSTSRPATGTCSPRAPCTTTGWSVRLLILLLPA